MKAETNLVLKIGAPKITLLNDNIESKLISRGLRTQ